MVRAGCTYSKENEAGCLSAINFVPFFLNFIVDIINSDLYVLTVSYFIFFIRNNLRSLNYLK